MNSPRSAARDGFGYLLRGGIATLVIGVMTVMIPRPVGATSFPEELGLPIPLAITISAPTNMLTSLGGTVQLTVIAAFSDATNEDVTAGDKGTIYGTEDPAVAVVDGDGLVTAVGNGKTTIYANLGNNLDSIGITVETPERLDEDCIASILNRQVQVSPDGTFALGNVPVPVGAFRVRVVCERPEGVERAQSPFTLGVPNGETLMGEITFGVDDPVPVSLELSAATTVLTPSTPGVQLVTTGTLLDGTQIDLTPGASGTFYVSSNPAIATVSADGLVNAVSSGTFAVTATYEGVISTYKEPDSYKPFFCDRNCDECHLSLPLDNEDDQQKAIGISSLLADYEDATTLVPESNERMERRDDA